MTYLVDADTVLMTNVEPEQQRVARPLPTGAFQLVGHGTGAVVEGLTTKSPWMLGIVMLNLVGIASAVYFLNLLIGGQQQHLKSLLELQQKQQSELIIMHKQEFDALLGMVSRETPLPVPPSPVPQPGGRRP